MGLRDYFRRKPAGDEIFDDDGLSAMAEIREQRETQVLRDVCQAIDVINANMDELPRGVKPWMQWGFQPRLTLVQMTPPDREVLHGDGFHRMEFD